MTRLYKSALVLAVAMSVLVGGASAQPTTKLTTGLDTSLIGQVWCSALFYEESYWHDAETDWALYYEDLAYTVEDDLRPALERAGLGDPEIVELWEIQDAAALDLAEADPDTFNAQLAACDAEFGTLLPKPKR